MTMLLNRATTSRFLSSHLAKVLSSSSRRTTPTHVRSQLPSATTTTSSWSSSSSSSLSTVTIPKTTLSALNNETLASLPGVVSTPNYDRSQVKHGILHVGVGNFHRAHMAAYVDDLLQTSFDAAKDWGIVGAGIVPRFDQPKRDMLERQDWLQTLIEHDAADARARVLGCMTDFLPIETDAIRRALENPDIKIVSLTVTEGGYFLNDGKFNPLHPHMVNDVSDREKPVSIFGLIVQAARYRREHNLPLFTVMSCDNIPHNGDIVKSVVLGLAKAQDTEFASWLEQNMAFPNSMVDRITPATTQGQIDFVHSNYNYHDECPVFCEPFQQWVLEDSFTAGRPQLDLLPTVKFVPDVAPYEFMKIRILNGGHASLCYPAALLDLPYVHDAMQHPVISKFLDCLERAEIIPTVPPVPDTNLKNYWKTIAGRFENPTLKDTIGRICYDGLSRQPKFIFPVAKDNANAGRSVDGMALVSAMWCRYCYGTTESGQTIAPNDPEWDRLQALAKASKAEPKAWLAGLPEVYGGQVSIAFTRAFEKALNLVHEEGVEAAMNHFVASHQTK